VILHRKVSNGTPGFPDTLERLDRLGQAAAAIGDVDGDGVTDLAVGAAASCASTWPAPPGRGRSPWSTSTTPSCGCA
jgi:hypothetical protein